MTVWTCPGSVAYASATAFRRGQDMRRLAAGRAQGEHDAAHRARSNRKFLPQIGDGVG